MSSTMLNRQFSADIEDWEADANTGAVDPLAGIELERPVAQGTSPETAPAPTATPTKSTGCLYLDLETVPDEERMHLFGLPALPELPPTTASAECPPPSELLDLSIDKFKVAIERLNPDDAYLELLMTTEAAAVKPRSGIEGACKSQRSKRREVEQAEDDRRKLMSTTPEFCKIVAVGFAVGGDFIGSSIVGVPNSDVRSNGEPCPPQSEENLLSFIWSMIDQYSPIIGFNILGFDIQVIRARSIILGVEPSRTLNDSPWGNREVCDLMLARFGKGGRAMKMKDLAKLYGIPVPAGDTSGADVETLWKTDPVKLREYVESDIEVTRALHRKFSGYFCV